MWQMVRPEGYGVQYPFDVEQPTLRGALHLVPQR